MSVLAQALFTLVRRHFMSLSFLSARHNLKYVYLTELTKVFAGLKAGMSCAGMVRVVLLVMFLAVF